MTFAVTFIAHAVQCVSAEQLIISLVCSECLFGSVSKPRCRTRRVFMSV